MRLDIRLPIGMLFSISGVLLVLFGALSNRQLYARSLNINVNLWWGLAMLVFGIIMLVLGRSRKHAGPIPAETPARTGSSH
jgi:uncharacterized protein YhhL (DUF1145 family)